MRWQLLKAKLAGSFKSWVMLFNTLMAAAPSAVDYAQMHLPLLREFVPANIYGWAFGITVAVNILLRFFRTNGPLENKSST